MTSSYPDGTESTLGMVPPATIDARNLHTVNALFFVVPDLRCDRWRNIGTTFGILVLVTRVGFSAGAACAVTPIVAHKFLHVADNLKPGWRLMTETAWWLCGVGAVSWRRGRRE
jgi:hypothetical protein